MLRLSIVVLGLLLVASAEPEKDSNCVVQTSSGVMRGKSVTVLNKNLRLFLGVPYAQPPTDSLRFLPPRELEAPSQLKDATMYAPSCYQPPHLESVISPLLVPNKAEISEDCLYLNVFVPETNGTNLPVMVWLAGEGFDYADPQQFDGSYLAAEGKVIVVTVNYRLSVFGFLSTLTEDAPGNVGLLDQRMALRWVRQNVAEFGGNPQNVTLFGRFTGAMSAAIHAFSPLSKEESLFQRIILQSGVPVGDWVFDRNPMNSTYALAEANNCDFPFSRDIIKCLKKVPADRLLKDAMNLPQRFRPVYDFHLIRESFFKSVSKAAPVDVLIGMNNDEGSLCTITLNAMDSPLYKKILNQELSAADFSQLVHENMLAFYKNNDSLLNKLANYEYKTSGQRLRNLYIKFCGDIYITSRAQKLADIISERGMNTYMYEFAHRPSFSIHPSFIRAGHGDDVLYSLGLPLKMTNLPEGEARLTRRMIQAFTNFARTGNPNLVDVHARTYWPRYTYLDRELMSFTTFQDKPMPIEKSSHDEAVIFWNDIIPAAQHRTCPVALPPMASGLYAPDIENESLGEKTYFLGTHITLPTAEYIMLCLVGISGGFFIMFIVGILLWFKVKKGDAFQRLA